MKTLLVAGGTGGHLIPAVALAGYLNKEGPCFLMSTNRPVDRLVSQSRSLDGNWLTVELDRMTPVWNWFSPRFTTRQIRAMGDVRNILRRKRPDVVIGFGGYLSAVGVTAARMAGIPTVVHEQNLLPGRANWWLARIADAVAVSFPETKSYLPTHARVEVTGNPLSLRLGDLNPKKAREMFGLDSTRPVVLVLGGSQGSHFLNAVFMRMWKERSLAERKRLQVIHSAGAEDAPAVKREYAELGMDAKVFPFLREIHAAYAVAHLAVSRAGATTLAELCVQRLPAVLIPYRYAGGHQRANADWMRRRGGAIVMEEMTLTSEQLWVQLSDILGSADRLSRMRQALASQESGSSLERLACLVKRVAHGGAG